MNLGAFEDLGVCFRLDGDRLKVTAPENLLDDDTLNALRQHKAELVAECRLRVFLSLVQAFGVSYGRLLDPHQIRAALDEADLPELMTSAIADRQTWAKLLAYRLTR